MWSTKKYGDNNDEELNNFKREASRWEQKTENRTLSESERGSWKMAPKNWLEKEGLKIQKIKQKSYG